MTKKKKSKRVFKRRNPVTQGMIENPKPAGPHHTRERDVDRGSSRKRKHKEQAPETTEE